MTVPLAQCAKNCYYEVDETNASPLELPDDLPIDMVRFFKMYLGNRYHIHFRFVKFCQWTPILTDVACIGRVDSTTGIMTLVLPSSKQLVAIAPAPPIIIS